MRRNKTITLGEALGDLIREYRLEKGLKEAAVLNIWCSSHLPDLFSGEERADDAP